MVTILDKSPTSIQHRIFLISSGEGEPSELKSFQREDWVVQGATKLTGNMKAKTWVVDVSLVEDQITGPLEIPLHEQLRRCASKIAAGIEANSTLHFYSHCDELLSTSFLEGFVLSLYRFERLKSKKEEISQSLWIENISEEKIQYLKDIQKHVFWVRDQVNTPLSHLSAEKFCEEISCKALSLGCESEVLGMRQIESLKMGGVLAVNKGSYDPPAVVVASWNPDNAINKKPLVFVGKGIVYDTGGLSLKSTLNSMDIMKSDMAGGAAVAGALFMIAAQKLPIHVKIIVPATDNRPGKNAIVPGDVITHHDGTTVEVMNTDAEGRLILADGISYAHKFDPEMILTMATLTGASFRATGHYASSIMGNDDEAIKNLLKSGDYTGERLSQAPFWNEYNEELKSDVADLKNVGSPLAGHITAGKFLEHFSKVPFVHVDIASSGWLDKKTNYHPKGGTGIGVRMLFNFVKSRIG